jgi:hypothetical protein
MSLFEMDPANRLLIAKGKCHVEREFDHDPERTFVGLRYHQIRFVCFGIWFLGFFLVDFTQVAAGGDRGVRSVLTYVKVFSIIHMIVTVGFLAVVVYRFPRNVVRILQAAFDLSLHVDIGALTFSVCCLDDAASAMFVAEAFVVLDIACVLLLASFKRWRALIDLVGILPSMIVLHCKVAGIAARSSFFPCLPIAIVLLCPLIFTVAAVGIPGELSAVVEGFIDVVDPALLPNKMFGRLDPLAAPDSNEPPSIFQAATSTGQKKEYFDFKSVPFAVAATFFINYGCFAAGKHSYSMVIMVHYFVMLAMFLINTRVVAFPSIVLTSVKESQVQFNSVWPELNFV